MANRHLTQTRILQVAEYVIGSQDERAFRTNFGVSPIVCCKLWQLCFDALPATATPKHLLLALFFLKVYSSEDIQSSRFGMSRKTVRTWTWRMVKIIADQASNVVRAASLNTIVPCWIIVFVYCLFILLWLSLILLFIISNCRSDGKNDLNETKGRLAK